MYVYWVGAPTTCYLEVYDNLGSQTEVILEGDVVKYTDSTNKPYIILNYNSVVRDLGKISREGYKFINWHTTEDFTTTENVIKVGDYCVLSGDSNTLYAEWVPITWTVEYLSDGTEDPWVTTPSQTFVFDEYLIGKDLIQENKYTRTYVSMIIEALGI